MIDYLDIYRHHASEYDLLISREDYQLNLPRALNLIRAFDQADVVELGAGTGRVTLIAAAQARSVMACDCEPSMLAIARATIKAAQYERAHVVVGDNCALPVPDQIADIAIAGWSIGHAQAWYRDAWPELVDQALAQMRRVLRPDGTLIIIETLGTGQTEPRPPHERLAAYYQYLEQHHAFQSVAIRTDYRFVSLDEAKTLAGFFFGDEMAQEVERNNWIILPECTGIWWRAR